MKAERPYPQVHITPKGQRALQAGHPWVYAGEVTELTGPVEDGGLTDIIGSKSAYLGTGFYNSHSLIRCRLLSATPTTALTTPFGSAGCSTPGTTARA